MARFHGVRVDGTLPKGLDILQDRSAQRLVAASWWHERAVAPHRPSEAFVAPSFVLAKIVRLF